MFLGLLFLALSAPLHAQVQESQIDGPQSLVEQYEVMMTPRASRQKWNNIYYRTIKERDLIAFKGIISDSLAVANAKSKRLNTQLSLQVRKMDSIQVLFNQISQNNAALEKEKNSMAFLGIPSTKSSYRVISWTLILSLLGGLLFFIFKFRNSNFLTQQAKSALEEMEQEFEQHRRWALDREQKLSRELLDERNKKKK